MDATAAAHGEILALLLDALVCSAEVLKPRIAQVPFGRLFVNRAEVILLAARRAEALL